MEFDVFEYTNKGGRSYNEDSVGCAYGDNCGIFAAADGLGGHLLGEEASELAVETIIGSFGTFEEDLAAQLKESFAKANARILALQKEKNAAMKTTAAALAIIGEKTVWANTGDSRVYFIHRNALHACTEDHSVAYKKYKAGEITREQLATDEDQSRLIRSLGSPDRYEPDTAAADVPLEPGDAFLLCSDGAWEYLRDFEIVIDLLKSQSAKQWAENMLIRIMERLGEGNDNLTLLTVMIG